MKKTKLSSLQVLTVIVMLIVTMHSCGKENAPKCEYCTATKDGQSNYKKVCNTEERNAFENENPGAVITCE